MTYAALPILSGDRGLARYLNEIRQFPLLEPQQEYTLAKRWREHDDREAARQLITSHLRLVAKLAMRNRRYGLPMSEIISEGNVGLMQALKRFEPERGFRFATYAMWWIKASIQEYIMRSWSLVKISATANQRKLFFNLRRAKSRISSLDGGDLRSDQVKQIAKQLGASERDVIDMDRRLSGDASLNVPLREGDGEWQDLLADDADDQEHKLVESEEASKRHDALAASLGVLNPRERRIFEARRLTDDPMTLAESLLRTRREPRARTPDRVPRLRKDSTRGEDGVRGAGSNPDFSGSRIERIGSRRAATRRCRCIRMALPALLVYARRSRHWVGFVALLRRPCRRPRSHCASGARGFLAARPASFQCRDVLDARIRGHGTEAHCPPPAPPRHTRSWRGASAWLFGVRWHEQPCRTQCARHCPTSADWQCARSPAVFNPATARMSEVALVDPIALSKDRKKAPLSAPS